MEIKAETLHEIKELPLPQLLKDYGLPLKETNPYSYQCLCPFHEDTNPSMRISQKNGKWLWHCFGCNKSGNVLDFVMAYEKIPFARAYEKLEKEFAGWPPADSKSGIKTLGQAVSQLPVKKLESKTEPTVNRQELLERAVSFYQESFLNDRRGVEYLASRGIRGEEIYQSFRIGLVTGGLKKTLSLDDNHDLMRGLKEIGLLNTGGHEHFLNCVIFPIFDENDNVSGIYGRKISFLNPPKGETFSPPTGELANQQTGSPSHLYLPGPRLGVWNWQALKLSKEIILTESIIDALSCYVLGFRNVIPLYGVNGLTADHLKLFQKYLTRKIYLCLDNDQAGREARSRIKEKLSGLGIEVIQTELPPEFKDINEALQKGFTKEQFSRLASLPVSRLNKEAVKNEDRKIYPKISQQDDLIMLDFGPRQYRIRGLNAKNLGTMKVNLKVQSGDNYHLDSFDLYSAKARSVFISQCRKIFSAGEAELSQELSRIIGELEKIQADSLDLKTPVKEKQMTPEEEQEALQSLKSPSLLQDILKDIEILGYVGESANKAIGYLVSVSRKLSEPLSCVIISQSSAGKSALAEFLEKLCPPEECLLYSRLTPQALYYMDKEALKRKLLIIEERAGAEAADYSIRTLQSRKKLTQAVPLKDPNTGKIRTMNFEVEGPIAYIETTTRPRINEENATRCFELYLDESKEQTKRIQQAQKEAKTLSGLNKKEARDQLILKQQNMQRLLKEVRVVNPYACLLEFPADWLRTRRDHLRFLNLIEAITFLYQYQRQIKKTETDQEYIESTLEDYRTAYDLAKEVLGESFTELKKPQRELLEKIETLIKEEHQEAVNRRQIREYTGLGDHRLRDLLAELVSLEYLWIMEGKQGKSYRYQLADRCVSTEKILAGLTTPEELVRKLYLKA